MSYQKYLRKKYPAIFGEGGEGSSTEGEVQKDTNWGWYEVIVFLAEERMDKMDYVIKKNHIEVLNFLTFKIDLNARRKREIEKNYGKL